MGQLSFMCRCCEENYTEGFGSGRGGSYRGSLQGLGQICNTCWTDVTVETGKRRQAGENVGEGDVLEDLLRIPGYFKRKRD